MTEEQVQIEYLSNDDKDRFLRLATDLKSCTDMKGLSAMLTDALPELTVFDFFLLLLYRSDQNIIVSVGPARRAHLVQKGEDMEAFLDGELGTPIGDLKVVRKAISGKRAIELDIEGTVELLQKLTGKAKKEVHRLAQIMNMNKGLLQPISVFEGLPKHEVVVGLLFVTTRGERIEKVDRLKLSLLSKQIGIILINELNTRRLQKELDAKEGSQRLLEAFNKATLGVQMSFDEEAIYRSLTETMRQSGIGLLVIKKDAEKDVVTFRHMTSLKSTQTAIKHSLSLDLEDLKVKASDIPKLNEMFALTKPIFLDDIAEIMKVLLKAMGQGSEIKRLQSMFPVEKGIICPLIVKGRCNRILVITKDDLTPQHLLSVEVFAMHVRNALDRLLIQVESEEKSKQLHFMHELSSALSRSLTIDWVLEVLRKELPKVHQFDHIGMLLLDKELRSGTNFVVREVGEKGTAVRMTLTFDEKEAKVMGEATDLASHTGEPDKDALPMAKVFNGTKVRCYLILPLRVENRLLGFLELGCHEGTQFNEHVLSTVTLMREPVSIAVYNADLLTDERKRSEQLRVVAEVSRFSTSVTSLKSLYREVLRLLSTTFGYRCIHIIRFDKASNKFIHVQSSDPEDDKRFKDLEHPGDKGVLGRVLKEKRTIIVPNTKEDPDYLDVIGGMLSEMAVPILYDGEVVLLINLESKDINAFDNDDALTIETVANEVSSLLRTLGNKEKEERRLEQLSVINDIGKGLLQIADVDKILSTVAHVMDERLGFRGIRVFLIDRNTKGLVLKALAGMGEKAQKGSTKEKVGELVPLGTGPVGLAATKGSTTLSGTQKDEHRDTRRGGLARGALLCSPFKVKDDVEGVLCMEAPEDRTLDEWDQLALESMAREVGKALEMAHAFEETDRRSKLLELVNSISLYISKDLSKKGIMERFTSEFQKSRKYLDVAIFLLDNDRRSLVKQAQSGDYKGKSPPDYSQNIDEGLFGVCLQKKDTLVVNDVSKDKRFKARPWVKTKSEMVSPIKIAEEVIGLINVESDKFGAFEDWDRLAVDTLARSLAMALQNAQLFEEEQRRSDLLKVLDELSGKALKASDLDILLQETVETLEKRFKLHSVCIFMEDERKWPLGVLKIRATTGAYKDLAHQGTELPSEQGLIGSCFRSAKPILCNDTTLDKRFIPEPVKGSLSELCIPIIVGSKPVGVLNIESDKKNAFTQLDVMALGTVSDIISRAIQNLGQVEELTRRTRDISGVMEVEKGLTAELDLDPILQHAVKLIKKNLGYQNVEFYLVDDEAYDLELKAIASDGDRRKALQPGSRYSMDSGIIGQAHKLRSKVMVNEAMKFDKYFDGLGKTVRSAVAAPVLVNKEVVGILNIESDEPNEFGDWDSLIITVLSDLLSGALDRAMRYKEQQERERIFTIAYETGNELAKATSIESLLKKAAEIIKAKLRFVQVEISSISTDDGGNQELVLRAVSGSLKKKAVTGTKSPLREGLLGWCVSHKENAIVNDVTVDPRSSEEKGGEVKSEMVVLISVDDGIFGAVSGKSRHFSAFSDRDLNALETVVKQLENLLWHLKKKGPN